MGGWKVNRHHLISGIAALLLSTAVIFGAGCQKASTGVAGGTPGAPPAGAPGGQPPGQPGSNSAVVVGTAVFTQDGGTATKTGVGIDATSADQSAVLAKNGGVLALSKVTLTKAGNTSSEDNSNFYGLNASVLAEAGSSITLTDCKITTGADGANGVFATGSGAKITLSGGSINTTANSSRGLDVTQGGTIVAANVDITTAGAHCAAIASDRGGGTVSVTGGTMRTAGEGSPGIYSTADISVTGAKLTATGSEAAVIEGKNSIALTDVALSGAKNRGVMLYQSFSGDAEVGASSFKMAGGSLTALAGPLFYITNTDSMVELTGVSLSGKSGTLLTAAAGQWGTQGSNGGKVVFTARKQTLSGNVTCDSISSVTLALKEGSTLTGAVNTEQTAGSMALSLDKASSWNVTGTSYLTSLTDEDATLANIRSNGNTVYYDTGNSANSWLAGKTYSLSGGGTLRPAK